MDADLRNKVNKGLSWSFVNQLVMQIALIAFNIYLARILEPHVFGLVAMVTVFSGFALFLVDAGFSAALVQRQDITQEHLSTAFWVNMGIGIFLFFLFYFLAAPLAAFYKEPVLESITKVTSIGFVISAFGLVQNSVLVKKMDFKSKSIINWIATAAGYILATYLAYNSHGVWAIVWLNLTVLLVNTILVSLFVKWLPSFTFSVSKFKSLFSFGGHVMGDTLVNYWSRNADNFLIGKYVGSDALGLYSRAYTIMLLPIRNISSVIARVMFPAFASIQNDIPQIRTVYLKTIRYIAYITFPLMFGLAVLAEEFVIIFFGQPWLGMAPILQCLSILGAFQSIVSLNGMIYNSLGKAHIAFKVSLIVNAILVFSFIIGVFWGGVMGVAIVYLLVGTILSVPIYERAIREIELPLLEAFKVLLSPLVASVFMALSVCIVRIILTDFKIAYLFIICTLCGFFVYSITLYLFDENFRKIVKTRQIN